MNNNPKGMLFKGAMVNGLLNSKVGSWPAEPIDPSKAFKWQTRRLMRVQPIRGQVMDAQGWHWNPTLESHSIWGDDENPNEGGFAAWRHAMAPHPVGSLIYVKETFARVHPGLLQHLDPDPNSLHWSTLYRADGDYDISDYGTKWKPSIFMPRSASRITLEVMRVRVEKICDITEDDAAAEGCSYPSHGPQSCYRSAYKELIESINGSDAWKSWSWAYDLKRIK